MLTWVVVGLLFAVGGSVGSPRFAPRLSEVEWSSYHEREPQGPGTYTFGYDIEDPQTGNTQFRQEERYPNGTVEGSYGWVQPDGNIQVVHYVADHLGYRTSIENSQKRNENHPPGSTSQSTLLQHAIASQQAGPSPIYEQHTRPISNQLRGHAPYPQQPISNQHAIASQQVGPPPIYEQHTRPINNQLRGHAPYPQQPIGNQFRLTSNVRPFNNQNQVRPNVRPFNNQNQVRPNVRPFNAQNQVRPNVPSYSGQYQAKPPKTPSEVEVFNSRPTNYRPRNNYQYPYAQDYSSSKQFANTPSSPSYYSNPYNTFNNYL